MNIDGVTGYLSDVGNIDEMASNAIAILSDSATHFEFRKNAIAKAREFDVHRVVPKYEKLYQQVLAKSHARV